MAGTEKNKAGLGTFSGVFTPSVLTILGIILFLRMGYVTGSAGLGRTLVIIAIANLISVFTSFSLAAVATNMKVRGGGDYYLISRTLGLEFGGAIGIVLFLAQSVSIGFYCIGFGEAVSAIAANRGFEIPVQAVALAALGFLFVLAWVGADLATKFQYLVMLFLILALASFYGGGIQKWDTGMLMDSLGSGAGNVNFWLLFAVFFPAVTGFTQGVSMSGDLSDPGRSLPLGTFLAVGVSILVYFSVAVFFAASSPLDVLATDYGAMGQIALWPGLIDAGIISATLSSAMASFLGAPRILQSLAGDKIFGFLNRFARGVGPSKNPRRAVLFSFAIAGGTIGLGELDLIARIVSMFFLISYGLLNYATYFEAATRNPSFRPRFKWYHPRLSLAGFLACLGVMLAIDLKTGIASAAVLFAIYQYLKQTAGPGRWADSQRSYHLQKVRDNLIAAEKEIAHPREWRPYMLVLADAPESRRQLLDFAGLLESGSGIISAVKLIQGSGMRARRQREKEAGALKKQILENGQKAFSRVVSAIDADSGLSVLLQSYGIGPVRANTVLMDWREQTAPGREPSQSLVGTVVRSGCNAVLLHANGFDIRKGLAQDGGKRTIDVWWKNDDTSRLLLLLAHLTCRTKGWESSRIRLLAIHFKTDNQENREKISGMLADFRIQAECSIVPDPDNLTLVEYSKASDLVLLPVSIRQQTVGLFTGEEIEPVLSGLKSAVLGVSAQKIELDADPEEGEVRELAALYDQFRLAEKKADLAHKYAVRTESEARDMMERLKLSGEADIRETVRQALETRQKAEAARQRAERERLKRDRIQDEARARGVSTKS